ncbi:MAG: LysR substrate-binding domain-containing protein [Cyanobacteria bacterium P01_C01_bin.120]
MEIYQLKVFLEVANCLSFTEAADALNLTQPAVSSKIKSLESELEAPLFERLGRRIELTNVGEYLLQNGPQLVDLEGQLLSEIEAIRQGKFNTLTIGCTADIANSWLPTRVYKYRQTFPEVQTKYACFDSAEKLYRSIKLGEVDIGFSGLSFSKFDEISETVVDTVNYALIVSRSHRLAQQSWLSLKDLVNQSWVLQPEDSASRIILQERLHELGLSLNDIAPIETVNTHQLISTYLLQGHYISFASDLEFQMERQAGLLCNVPLQEFALGAPLFLLMSKRLQRTLADDTAKSFVSQPALEPIKQFMTMLQTQRHLDRESMSRSLLSAPSSTKAAPSPPNSTVSLPRFQAPYFQMRSAKGRPSETLKLTIGTQNQTIQTVTAGLIIQRLGLLEHYLPREGRYSNTGYQVRWVNYSSGSPIVNGLKTKEIDIGVLGDYPLLLSAVPVNETAPAAGTRLISFVASNPDGTGNDIVVPCRSQLNSIEDLGGRTIAVPFESAAHGMLMRSLNHRQLLQQVNLTAIDTLNTRKLTKPSSQVDGYAYFAPFHEIVKHQGQFRRLHQERIDELPTFHGVVIRDDLAEQYPEIAVAYLQALLAAQHWYTTHPMATTLVSNWANMDAAIVAKTLLSTESLNADVVYHSETQPRLDWLQAHIRQLGHIKGQESIAQINLGDWVQSEFLDQAIAAF